MDPGHHYQPHHRPLNNASSIRRQVAAATANANSNAGEDSSANRPSTVSQFEECLVTRPLNVVSRAQPLAETQRSSLNELPPPQPQQIQDPESLSSIHKVSQPPKVEEHIGFPQRTMSSLRSTKRRLYNNWPLSSIWGVGSRNENSEISDDQTQCSDRSQSQSNTTSSSESPLGYKYQLSGTHLTTLITHYEVDNSKTDISSAKNELNASSGAVTGTATRLIGANIVYIQEVPATTGWDTIISQLCGGAIERVVRGTDTQGRSEFCSVEVHFQRDRSAVQFYHFTLSGRFFINGVQYKAQMLPENGPRELVSKRQNGQVFYQMERKCARRCLYLIPDPSNRSDGRDRGLLGISRSMSSQRGLRRRTTPVHKSDHFLTAHETTYVSTMFDMGDLKHHFGKFGCVASITPIISNRREEPTAKMCIQYTDVRPAIFVKQIYQQQTQRLDPIFEGYTLEFGDDPADRACPYA